MLLTPSMREHQKARVEGSRSACRLAFALVPLNLLAALALTASSAFADALPSAPEATAEWLDLAWIAPADCTEGAAVLREVARLLGGSPGVSAGSRWNATATVAHQHRWHVVLETGLGPDTRRREFEAETSCRGLVQGTALVLALIIDPDRVATQAAELEQSVETAAPAPSAPASASVRTPAADAGSSAARSAASVETSRSREGRGPAPARAVQFLIGASALGELGALPGRTYGIGADLGLQSNRVRLDLSLVEWLNTATATTTSPSGASGEFRLVSGAVSVCERWLRGRILEAGPCGQVEFGRVRAVGTGVSRGFSASALWLALGAGAQVSWEPWPGWAFPLRADLLVPLERPRFYFRNVPGDVYRTGPLAGKLTFAAELHF